MKPTPGAQRYVVEWMPRASVTEEGNPDSGTERRIVHEVFQEAERHAWNMLPDDYWGCVSIERQVYQIDAETEEIEGRRVYRWIAVQEWAVTAVDESAETVP